MPGRGAVRIVYSPYTHWRGDFYPAELRPARGFAHDALRVEVIAIDNRSCRSLVSPLPPRWPPDYASRNAVRLRNRVKR